MPPVDVDHPLPQLLHIIIYYVMTFYAMRDFPIFLKSKTATKETIGNSPFQQKRSNYVGYIRKKKSNHKVMPRRMENMMIPMFIEVQL